MPPEHRVSVINMARPDLSPPLSHNLLTSNDLCIYLRGVYKEEMNDHR